MMKHMVSFIIPAYNEEAMIGRTVEALQDAASAALRGQAFEIIVVNDGSTDRTAEIAQQTGARVVNVNLRHIAAARNAGAAQAKGDRLIFVDADTLAPESTLRAALEALDSGAVGGGAAVRFDDAVPALAKFLAAILMWGFVKMRIAAGCFIFCRRDAFEAAGGFDERFFASEEIWISIALKRQGRFVMTPQAVVTSGRKVRMHGLIKLLWMSMRVALRGTRGVQRREGLELWYDGRREAGV